MVQGAWVVAIGWGLVGVTLAAVLYYVMGTTRPRLDRMEAALQQRERRSVEESNSAESS